MMPRLWILGLLSLASAGPVLAQTPLREVIDREVSAVWEREKLTPAGPVEDAAFHRRVSLDLIGTIPTHEETLTFLGDADPAKRAKLVDRLLDDPRFAEHQADVWDLILFGRNPPGYDTDRRDGMQRWLQKQFADKVPYDQWVRTLLRAEGNSVDDGPPMFYMQYRSQPEDATEKFTQTFLGVQLQCARCHDHPYEDWQQVDFYGMAAFFARLNIVSVGKHENLTKYAVAEKSSGDILFTGPVQEQTPGKKGDPIKPKFLLGTELTEPPLPADFKEVKFEDNKPPPAPLFSRKDQLADWVARADNPFFARAIVNRIWGQFLGRGLVHPVDNMTPSNQPSHPALLDEMTQQFIAHGFDLRWLMRELVLSRPYQLAPRLEDDAQFPRWFEASRSRPLSAEELTAAWRVATGYAVWEQTAKSPHKGRYRPLEGGYVTRFFGNPNNGVGEFQGGLEEHLYLNNGPLGSLMVTGPGTLLEQLQQTATPLSDRVDRLYLSLLNRPPTDVERVRVADYIKPGQQESELWREAIWALMTSSEFRFNH